MSLIATTCEGCDGRRRCHEGQRPLRPRRRTLKTSYGVSLKHNSLGIVLHKRRLNQSAFANLVSQITPFAPFYSPSSTVHMGRERREKGERKEREEREREREKEKEKEEEGRTKKARQLSRPSRPSRPSMPSMPSILLMLMQHPTPFTPFLDVVDHPIRLSGLFGLFDASSTSAIV